MPTKEKTRDNCSTNNISCLSLVYILSLVLIYEKGFIKQLQYDHVSALQKEEIQILTVLLNEYHVLPMSYGHLENNKIVIDHGTLKGLESYIVKYDKRNRLASLDLFFLNQRWIAGVSLERKE